MAEVFPFAGTRFNTKEHQLDLSKIIAPPYDVISSDLQKELHEKDKHNVVRLACGFEAPGDDDDNNRYTRAAECYREWKARNLLVDEQRRCFYVYEHEFTLPGDKKRYKRRGFFALVKLQDYRSGKIRAHEMTFEIPKLDRFRLLKASMVNMEPIFGLYKDPEHVVDNILQTSVDEQPAEEITCENGDIHRVWLIYKKDPVLAINEALKTQRLYIADGTHRYETALAFRDEMRETTGRRDGRQPYDYIMMYLNNVDDEAINTSAMHRVLARDLGDDVDLEEILDDLGEYFEVKEFKADYKDIPKAAALIDKHLKPKKGARCQMIMALPGGKCFEMKLKKNASVDEMIDAEFMSELVKNQDVTVLHRYVIARGWIGNPEVELDEDDIFFCQAIEDALELVKRRKGCVAFLLNPIDKAGIMEIAENGELLPHNSTYFYPKVQTGFVLRDLQVGFA